MIVRAGRLHVVMVLVGMSMSTVVGSWAVGHEWVVKALKICSAHSREAPS